MDRYEQIGTELAGDIDPLGVNKVAILVSRQCDADPTPFFELVAQCPRQIEHDSLFSIALTRRPGIMSSVAGIYHNQRCAVRPRHVWKRSWRIRNGKFDMNDVAPTYLRHGNTHGCHGEHGQHCERQQRQQKDLRAHRHYGHGYRLVIQ